LGPLRRHAGSGRDVPGQIHTLKHDVRSDWCPVVRTTGRWGVYRRQRYKATVAGGIAIIIARDYSDITYRIRHVVRNVVYGFLRFGMLWLISFFPTGSVCKSQRKSPSNENKEERRRKGKVEFERLM
jgi:hypothetical protein